ncbi:low-density lipoprotein receptor-related protein 4-like isoform X1, partial [Biomphalaria pfeifferi]
PGGKIVGLAVDTDKELLFWSNTDVNVRSIWRARLNGTDVVEIVKDVEECNGLSIDWVSKHIYWTDAGKKTLEIANYNGSGRRILISSGLVNPRGIVVDPVSEYVFWADQSTRKIERSSLDGVDRKVIVDKDIIFPNQMAVSYPTRRLYWVDAKRQTIMSCDTDGGDVTKERDLIETSQGNPVFGLVVIGNTATISTWFHTKIVSTYVATRESLWSNEMVISSSTELYSLAATTTAIQPQSSHPCGQPDKGGCTHLCLPVRGTSYKCACPSYGGLALSFNAKSCETPSELLFFTMKESGEVGFISIRGVQSSYPTLVGRSTKPTHVTYDPIKQVVYWSDLDEGVIYLSHLAGEGEKEIFLSGRDGIGTIEGLALDWLSRDLYFVNVGQSSPGVDDTVYSWHRLEKISLDKRSRRSLVSAVEQPRGVALDLENGYMYYADLGKKAQIFQAQLDGSERRVLLDYDLASPTGLSFYEGRLYVADSNPNNKSYAPHLMVYDATTTEWTHLKLSNNFSIPKGLAVQGDTLYYSDWVSQDNVIGYIKSFNLRFGIDLSFSTSGLRPTGLFYSPLARRKLDSIDDVCTKSSCSHSCIKTPLNAEKPYKCLCPDESTHILASNNATCARPGNFLLVADLNTLKMVSLDDFTETGPRTVLYDNIDSNIAALIYDDVTDTIYWSDLTRQSIYASPFLDFEPRLVYQANYFIDGIVVDDKQRLFWTGYTRNGSGIIARLNLQRAGNSYHVIKTGLNNPRAIHLLSDKKLIFWTEYGGNHGPACVQRARSNGKNPKMLKARGLFWPNGLATHQQRLYVADGSGKLFSMDFEGENQEEVSFLTGQALHLFGIVVMDTVLFYSDWLTNSVFMVDKITGKIEPIVTHLSRPTNIAVYHPTNLTVFNQCNTEGKICTGGCVSVPRTFHCTCPVGSKLAADGFSCITMASPWEVTQDSKCQSQCHENAYCAQLVPLLKFDCVCKAGYEGNGVICSECGEDYFKPLLGNDTCYPCPLNSTTRGSVTATQCQCNNPQFTQVNHICTDAQTTASLTTVQTTTRSLEIITDQNLEAISTEVALPSSEPRGTLSQPYFDQCPHGELIKKMIPETTNQVWVPINWTARDGFGKELLMRSNLNISDNKIFIPWMANGNGKQHTVVFEAKDTRGQIATCQFQVLIEDHVPPRFTSCPDNIVKKTSGKSEPINWVPPVAVDNAHDPIVSSSHEPKSEFLNGTTRVVYTAKDWQNNSANCTFNVTLIYEQPCDLPEIKNGVINCAGLNADSCDILCKDNFILNPLVIFPQSFSCSTDQDQDVQELIRISKRQEPCLKHRRPTTAYQEFSLTFNGKCLPNSTSIKEILKEKIIDKLDDKRICRGAKCTHSPIKIMCPNAMKIKRFAEQKFNMTWNVTLEHDPQSHEYSDGFSPGRVKGILTDMKLELRKLAAHLTFFFDIETYASIPSSVSTKEFQWLCLPGEMKINDGCVPCPPGSYMNETEEECILCAEGFYQNTSMSIKCITCPAGITLELGAISEAECVTFPAMNEMSKFLIITSCSSAFIFLCMALFFYFWYNHHQRKKSVDTKAVDNGGRYMTSNVYGHTPVPTEKCPDYIRTSNRDFILGSHDYEDIDGHHRSTFETFSRRPPGCGDSLSSFKTHTDMTFLPTGSPNSSSMRTSDDAMMPGSPRESAKSFNLFADGGLQYTISPHGTMESFKGSPPPSPYRSLHLVANGPIPRGSSESPTQSHTLISLLGDESPYTSRLIRERLIDPNSPYRIISQERRNGSESPYKVNRRHEPESPHHMLSVDIGSQMDSPYRLINKESPYRSPAFQRELTHSLNRGNPEHGMRNYSHHSDNSLKSMPETSNAQRYKGYDRDEASAFMPIGDFLYKRPPSPLSPPISSRKSNDSLQRSPSTPRASPGMSRKRLDNPYKTPPMNQRRKGKPDFEVYEYE